MHPVVVKANTRRTNVPDQNNRTAANSPFREKGCAAKVANYRNANKACQERIGGDAISVAHGHQVKEMRA
jgi:hypothetical protein